MFIINTPFIFKTIWAFVNPMLEDRTRKKIHVLGAVSQGVTQVWVGRGRTAVLVSGVTAVPFICMLLVAALKSLTFGRMRLSRPLYPSESFSFSQDYLKTIKEVIPEENIPEMFGGKSKAENFKVKPGIADFFGSS